MTVVQTSFHKVHLLASTNKQPSGSGPGRLREVVWCQPCVCGVQVYAFLYHVVKHYHALAAHTMFMMGSSDGQVQLLRQAGQPVPIENEWKQGYWHKLLANWKGKPEFYCPFPDGRPIDYNFTLTEWNGTSPQHWPAPSYALAKVRPLGKWLETFIDRQAPSVECHGGMFWVSRDRIRLNSLGFYRRLLDVFAHSANAEDGHYMERLWAALFAAKPPE